MSSHSMFQFQSYYPQLIINLLYFRMQDSDDKVELTPAEIELRDILKNKTQFDERAFSEEIFNTDLVLKIKYPNEKYMDRKQQVPLGSIIKNPSTLLVHAHTAALEDLYKNMEEKGDNVDPKKKSDEAVLQVRKAKALHRLRHPKDNYKKLSTIANTEDTLVLECWDECKNELDAFTIQINTLIYTLQKSCGFKLRTFLISDGESEKKRSIYILISQNSQNVIKAANRYHIKKEIDYSQFDLYLNEPVDFKGRPIKLNSAHEELEQKEPKSMINSKYVNRKLNAKKENATLQVNIQQQVKLQPEQIEKYKQFVQDLQHYLSELIGEKDTSFYNHQNDEDALTLQEKYYLSEINRGKINPGCQKIYMQMKKKRKFFNQLHHLCDLYEYEVYRPPKTFINFELANKKKKFFHRLQSVLFYKQSIINPFGDLSLFNKMEKIKVCYLVLKEYVRVENLNKIGGQVFALNDDFQKYGKIVDNIDPRDLKEGIKGGIDGKRLIDAWSRWKIWMTDFKTIRNYLGQAATYQILIKNYLLYLFMILIPFGIVGEIIKTQIIIPAYEAGDFLPEILFNLLYLLLIVIFYNIFIAYFERKEQIFKGNYMETERMVSFRYQFVGPFTRNLTNDSVNEYVAKKTFLSTLGNLFFNFIILMILGAEIGFYFGCRAMTIAVSLYFPQFDTSRFYLLYPTRLFGYLLFFGVNSLLYPFVIIPLTAWLTQKENVPTEQQFKESHQMKLYIFAIGIEVIGPIDLIFLQPLAKTSCFTDWCYQEFLAYVYCRFFIIFGLLIIKIIYNLRNSADAIKKTLDDIEIFREKKECDYEQKLSNYLEQVEKESKKPKADFKLIDETVALLLYGTFLMAFPLAPVFSFLLMYLQFFFERINMVSNCQRPISKSEKLESYTPKAYTILHWAIFFNLSVAFISLQWLQYYFVDLVRALSPIPSVSSIFTIKIMTIFLLMVLYQIVALIVRAIVHSLRDVRHERKANKIQKLMETGNRGSNRITLQLSKPKPLRSIARTFNTMSKQIHTEQSDQEQEENFEEEDKESEQKMKNE